MVAIVALFITCIVFERLYSYLVTKGIIQFGHSLFSRERELSTSFLPTPLKQLNATAYETFWNVVGHGDMDDAFDRFMCAVNLIDTERQLHGNPVDPATLPAGTVGQGESVSYLTALKSTKLEWRTKPITCRNWCTAV